MKLIVGAIAASAGIALVSAQIKPYPVCEVTEIAPPLSNADPVKCNVPNVGTTTQVRVPTNPCQDADEWEFSFDGCCDNDFGALDAKERYAYVPATTLGCAGKFTINVTEMVPGKIDACCDSCKCYGDPHCVAFDGSEATWVTCDTRYFLNEDTGLCKGTKENSATHRRECEGAAGAIHVENAGNKCTYNSAPDWDWVEYGSRCQINTEVFRPAMNMYENDAIKVTLYMGERGVITEIEVYRKVEDKTYWLNAKYGSEGCMIWYDIVDGSIVDYNTFEDTTGLPDGWRFEKVVIPGTDGDADLEDVFWTLETEDPLDPTIFLQCLGYHESRPDIDQRLNAKVDQGIDMHDESDSGYCPTGIISERPEGYPDVICSTEGAPYRQEFLKYCQAEFDEFCTGTFPQTTLRFNKWYSRESQGEASKIFEWCKRNWCETRQLPEMEGETGLKTCVEDVADFKFDGAETFYPPSPVLESCVDFVPEQERPATDDCEDGFVLQYCSTGSDCPEDGQEGWQDHSWIPIENYCPGSVSFYKEDPLNEGLFTGAVRLAQIKCNSFGAKCNAWASFNGKIEWATSCFELHRKLNLPAEQGGWDLYTKNGDLYTFALDSCNEWTEGNTRRLLQAAGGR